MSMKASRKVSLSNESGRASERLEVVAPALSWPVPLGRVPDEAFSKGHVGPGLALELLEETVRSPCGAIVKAIARSKHAITLELRNGAELLIHVGLETVTLNGEGFSLEVAEGDQVDQGDVLLRIDHDLIVKHAKSLATPIVLLNADEFEFVTLELSGVVKAGDTLGSVRPRTSGAAQPVVLDGTRDWDAQGPDVEIRMRDGIHARPAARIVELAKKTPDDVGIQTSDGFANAKSVSSLMALGIECGDVVNVVAQGELASSFVDEISALLRAGAGDPVISVTSSAIIEASTPKSSPVDRPKSRTEFSGVVANRGEAVGPIMRLDAARIQVRPGSGDRDIERDVLEASFRHARAELVEELAGSEGVLLEILTAHRELLNDPELEELANRGVTDGDSAGAAVRSAFDRQAQLFSATGSDFLRQRIDDLYDVEGRVLRSMYGLEESHALEDWNGSILVADDLLPSQFVRFADAGIAGIALGKGGASSHVSLLAAARSIPMLVGLGESALMVESGSTGLVESNEGRFVFRPSEAEVRAIGDRMQRRKAALSIAQEHAFEKSVTQDDVTIEVMANVASVDEAKQSRSNGADGSGLVRSEILFLGRSAPPDRSEQKRVYSDICKHFDGRSVTFRTLDAGSDKPLPYIDFGFEENPALGVRGIRTFQLRPDLMAEQLAALIDVHKKHPIEIMIPMVTSVEEVVWVREEIERIAAREDCDKQTKVGIMIETPASVLLIDKLLAVSDFVSVGTNDLNQYMLAIDRGHSKLSGSLSAIQPAVLEALRRVSDAASRLHIPVSVCGGMASDPVAIPLLLAMGIRKLSVPPASVGMVKSICSRLSVGRCAATLQSALQLDVGADIGTYVLEQHSELRDWL